MDTLQFIAWNFGQLISISWSFIVAVVFGPFVILAGMIIVFLRGMFKHPYEDKRPGIPVGSQSS